MAIACSPDALVDIAACLKCVPTGMQREVLIVLLARIAEIDPDPKSLMEAAKCIRCIPSGMQDEVITYLLCQIAAKFNLPA